MDDDALTPAQRRVVTELMGKGQPRPLFDDDLGEQLRAALTADLGGVANRLPADTQLHVNKSVLSRVHQCETHHAAEAAAGFPGWGPATAKGVVAHKAIELGVFVHGDLPPLELVDHAIERLIEDGDDRSPASWLIQAPAVELGELRAAANDIVAKFQDCFPPLKAAWRPRLESSARVDLAGGRIVLRAKVDLALGRAIGNEARVLVVDFKTGAPAANHGDDLRYYALLETLRSGVPPFRVATYYLEAARWHHEDVTEVLLEAARRRVVGGVTKLVELAEGRPPTLNPGPACNWCSLRSTCDGAITWAEARAS